MSLSSVSIKRPVLAWMLMLALILFGAIAFHRMGISQMPDVNFPVVNISLRLDNAAPGLMEENVVDPIEDAVMGIDGLSKVSSSISQGKANITCEFKLDHNIDIALQEVQNRIQQISNTLPINLFPPVITKTNPEDQPIMWVMVTADANIPIDHLMMYARNTLKDQLSTLAGVGDVTLAGYVDPNLRVWIDRKKLYGLDLLSTDIISAIQDEQIEQPAGRIEAEKNEKNIRVLGESSTADEFSRIRINNRSGGANYNPIPISRLSRIEEGVSDLRAKSRFDGKTVVGLGIVKQHGANAVEVSKSVHDKVTSMQAFLLPNFHLSVDLDTTQFIRDSVDELNMTLFLSAILTSIVCYLFLGSLSSTVNVLFAIPTSIVGAFIFLYFFGFTLNTFTLLGLSLAIGIVVDDAIMMLENIVRHFEMGKSKVRAALDGSNEIAFAALATTVAIAAIFLPVIFMKGVVGKFFYQYGITVTAAVFLSLFEALTLTPMRCSQFLDSSKTHASTTLIHIVNNFMENLSIFYKKILEKCLNHRLTVVLISLLIFSLSLFVVSGLKKELIPAQDQSLFLLNIKAPVGSSIQITDEVFKKAEKYLRSKAYVDHIYTTVGNYQNDNIVNAGSIYVILKDIKNRKESQMQIMKETRDDLLKILPGNEIFTQDLSLTGLSASRGYPVEFTIEGPDWNSLRQYSIPLLAKIKETGLVEDINTDFLEGMPEVQIIPNRDRAAERGVSISSIGQEVGNLIGGYLFNANTQYPKSGHRYDIRLRSEPEQFDDAKDINDISLRNNRGATKFIKVPQIAEVKMTTGPQLISRVDRARAIPVFANLTAKASQEEVLEQIEKIGRENLPPGYVIKVAGSAQAFREAFSNLIFALIFGIAIAYMVLASQFNSFIHPVTVLMALPFSMSGALLTLYFAHQSLSLFSMIGLILLMGIVKKNSILLVDFTNKKRAEGMNITEALLTACPVRLRPILMTSVATIVGALPGAFNFGPGAETRVPMALSIIGGVTLSTFLTLFVIPCIYSLLGRWEHQEVDEALEVNQS